MIMAYLHTKSNAITRLSIRMRIAFSFRLSFSITITIRPGITNYLYLLLINIRLCSCFWYNK